MSAADTIHLLLRAGYHGRQPMNLQNLLILLAVGASIVLLMQVKARLFPVIALGASGLEALLAFRVVKFSAGGVNLFLVLGGALIVAGLAVWMKTNGKVPVTAATAVALVGAVQVVSALL